MPSEMAKGDYMAQGSWTDVYFLGANLFFLLTKQPIHQGESIKILLDNILSGNLTPIPNDLTLEMQELLSLSLITDPDQRLTNTQDFLYLLRMARTAQKSRQLEKDGYQALEDLKLLVKKEQALCVEQKIGDCAETNLQRYVKLLEKYELAHRNFWAAHQIYPQNQSAHQGFVDTLTN